MKFVFFLFFTIPFTDENVQIVIYFLNSNGSNVSSGKIEIAVAKRGKLFYYANFPEEHTRKTIYEETYDDALKIVNSKSCET